MQRRYRNKAKCAFEIKIVKLLINEWLIPYLHNSIQPFEGHESEKIGSIVSGAVITSNGKLTPSFEYIAGLREAQSRVNVPGDFSSEKKVSSQMFPAVE